MRAIDMHVHVPRQQGLPKTGIEDGLRRYFKVEWAPDNPAEMAEKYAEWDILGVIFSVDTETTTSEPPDTNDYVASIVAEFPGQFIGFATVDPWKGDAAVTELGRSVEELGLKGLKLHPMHQAFFPNDTRFYPLYERCSELGVPVLFHTGFAAAGAVSRAGAASSRSTARRFPASTTWPLTSRT